MLGFVKSLLGLLSALAGFFRDRQLIEAGKDSQALEEVKEVEARVEKAESVDRTSDPVRDRRLRNRFDRAARRGE